MTYQHFPSFLFTEEQFNQASNYKRLQLQCQCCGKQFTRFKRQIEKHLQRLDGSITCDNQSNNNSAKANALNHLLYCSDQCINKKSKWNDIKTFTCPQCGKVFERPAGRVKQTKTGLQFCSQKCSRQYYSDHEIAREWSTFSHTNPNRNFLFDDKQLKESMGPSKSNEKLLPVRCIQCGKTFYVSYSYVKNFYNGQGCGKDNLFQMRFCSRKCFNNWQQFKQSNPSRCAICGEIIKDCDIEYGGRHFCSQYCRDRYSVYLKRFEMTATKGRSNTELYCEQFIKLMWPQLKVQFNVRDQLDSNMELDIWFPTLRLAFEINGSYHYMPHTTIYDQTLRESISKTIKKDQLKRQICQEKGIDLIQINTRQLTLWINDLNQNVIKPIVLKVYEHLNQPVNWEAVNNQLNVLMTQFDWSKLSSRKLPKSFKHLTS